MYLKLEVKNAPNCPPSNVSAGNLVHFAANEIINLNEVDSSYSVLTLG